MVEQFINFADECDSLSKLQSMNSLPIRLFWGNKFVFRDGNKIYRIDNPAETYRRILIEQLFTTSKISLFLPEKIEHIKWPLFIITSQQLVKIDKTLSEDTIEEFIKSTLDNYPLFLKLKERLEIQGCHAGNVGTDSQNRIRIFDCISNTAIKYDINNNPTLLDKEGRELIQWNKK